MVCKGHMLLREMAEKRGDSPLGARTWNGANKKKKKFASNPLCLLLSPKNGLIAMAQVLSSLSVLQENSSGLLPQKFASLTFFGLVCWNHS